jgi:hypothetical protein
VPDQNSAPPVPEVQAPATDTPGATQTDTAQNTPAAPDEYSARYVALQAEFSRRFPSEPIPVPTGDTPADYKALQRDFTLRTTQPKPGPKVKDDGIDYKAEWEKSEQERAEAVFGKDATVAFKKAKLAYERDPSPFGEMTMMEAYRQLMVAEVKPPTTTDQAPPKGQAVAPRVDSNRSDVSPDLALPTKADEARRGDKFLEQGIAGLLKNVPWGNR